MLVSLLLLDQHIYLNGEQICHLRDTNFPQEIEQIPMATRWVCRLVKESLEKKLLRLEVISYQPTNEEFQPFVEVSLPFSPVAQIIFGQLDTYELLKISRMKSLEKPAGSNVGDFQTWQLSDDPTLLKKPIWEHKIEFDFPIKSLLLNFGYAVALKQLPKLKRKVEFPLFNPHFRVEFEAIKNYFPKIIGATKVKVSATIQIQGENILNIETECSQLDLINPESVEAMKFLLVDQHRKKPMPVSIDKSLFTMDEFLSTIDENLAAGFYDTHDFLTNILKIEDSKHYRQLLYLSENHEASQMKLRFILSPFSFLFLLEGAQMNHLIWETLDTEEATYVWHLNKGKRELRAKVKEINYMLNTIKIQGKQAYLHSSPEQFSRISHDYSMVKNGFHAWKAALESKLV